MTSLPSARRRRIHAVIGGAIMVAWCGSVLWALYCVAHALVSR